MKKLFIIGILIAFLLIAIPATALPPVYNYRLFADKDVQIGNVTVTNNATYLNMTYVLDDNWWMNESHVANASGWTGFPLTKKNNAVPGLFPYSAVHQPPVQKYSYYIPLPPYNQYINIYLAAQADVTHKTGDTYDAEGGAWAANTIAGTYSFPGKDWDTYFYFHRIS